MKEIEIAALYPTLNTIAAGLVQSLTYPFELLPKIHDYILKLGPQLDPAVFEKRGEDVWVAKDAKIAPTAFINGPCIIDSGAEVRHCAFIRGNAIVGKGAVVGNSTELKNVLLFDGVQVPITTMWAILFWATNRTWAPGLLPRMLSPIKAWLC